MNQIINSSSEWICSSPHIVVNNVDWIQTRYLFVSCAGAPQESTPTPETHKSQIESTLIAEGFVQDPARDLQFPVYKPGAVLPLQVRTYDHLSQNSSKPLEFRKRKADELDSTGEFPDDCSVKTIHEDEEVFTSDASWEKFTHSKNQASRVATMFGIMEELRDREQVAQKPQLQSSTNFAPEVLDHSTLPKLPPPMNASNTASKAIMAALKSIQATLEAENVIELGWYVDVKQVDNIFQWVVELHSFPEELPITQQMQEAKIPSVVLELRFPDQFPFAPPFARVVRPRMLPFAQGGGGHVTMGGSICMELLTASGWSPALSIMNVLLNIRLAICDTEPHPARLDLRWSPRFPATDQGTGHSDYGVGEAIDGYLRACRAHGWTVPEGFSNWSRAMG
jgi:ubiquitin-conjugating enzyme E2 Q